jgi:hypothetical protein
MATRTFYATRDMKNPTGYGTRMLRAGDPVDLNGPQARLYKALGVISPTKPTKADLAAPQVEAAVVPAITTETVAPKPKPAPRKRTTRRKK